MIDGTLAGATFRLRTDAAPFAAYARLHLATVAGAAADRPCVDAILRWHEGAPPSDRQAQRLAGMERIDRDLYVGDGRLCWFRVDDLRDLHLEMSWNDGRLAVQGDFYFRLGNRPLSAALRRLRQWHRLDRLRARRFTTLLAYLVYYPCWWLLEQMQDFHPIHAAGVATDAGTIVLAGASGVGKSTLSIALATMPGARFLADSFVLQRGLEILAVREPVLLDALSRAWIGDAGAVLVPLQRSYGLNRDGYHLPAERLADGGRAAVLLFPRRAAETYVRPLSAAQAHQRLSAADLMINDLRRYWAFAAVMEQMVPAGLVARREAQLAQLTSGVPCYDLGVTAAASRAAVVDMVMRLLPTVPRHMAHARS